MLLYAWSMCKKMFAAILSYKFAMHINSFAKYNVDDVIFVHISFKFGYIL